MCRSQAEGGRRCPNSSRASAGHAGDMSPQPAAGVPDALPLLAEDDSEPQRESYEGTPWQGYDEYMRRSAELDRRIASGEKMSDIMRKEQLKRGEERIAQITREGW